MILYNTDNVALVPNTYLGNIHSYHNITITMQCSAISDMEYFILKIISIRISGSEAVFWGDLNQSMDRTINSCSWDCIQELLIVDCSIPIPIPKVEVDWCLFLLRMPGMHNKKLFWFSLVAIVSREMMSCSNVRNISSYHTML